MEENINLTNALKKYFGFDTFKGNQEAIIRNLLAGNDTFVLMPTGGGKSLCYQLPSLIMEGTAIVISPLIALMKNQVDAMRNFSEEDGVAHFINSSLNKSAIDQVKSDILSGKTKLLYVAPESLTKEENVEFLRGVKISFYAVDEAHCISEWGHDFRPEYRRIRPIINEIGKAPVIALTATATPKVRMDIQKNLGMLDAAEFKSSFNRPNLYYEVRPKTNNIDRDIIKFIKANSGKSGIIYCLSRKKVEELAEILQANGINARAYHAGMDSATRTANQDGFLKEDIDVIVATIAFGMGIDKPDVRFVIHYDIPKSLEGYYQETGRAGRDGGEGMCITFYSNKDLQKLEKFMQGKPVGILLTHGHFDHIMAVKEVKEKYQIPVYACRQEEAMLAEPTINMTAVYGSACSIKPDVLLDDGQIFEAAGFSIQMFHTPGHTKGSCCYYIKDEGVLFSGDTLFCGSVGRTDFPGGSSAEIVRSLHKLVDTLPEDTEVFPGHDASTTIGYEKRYNPFV